MQDLGSSSRAAPALSTAAAADMRSACSGIAACFNGPDAAQAMGLDACQGAAEALVQLMQQVSGCSARQGFAVQQKCLAPDSRIRLQG